MPRIQKSMSVRLLVLFALVIVAFRPGYSATTERQSISLNQGWEFRQHVETGAKEAVWRSAQVPGDVHLDLMHNGVIPEPFYRDNESKLQWIENADWEYRSNIQISADALKHKNVELVFEGLDSRADVYVNGHLALQADNMFREWRVDVKESLKVGDNQLLIVFPSPIRAAALVAAKDKWRTRTQTEEKTYIRKAAYEFGWDWGPRFVTSGVWRPVRLETWDEARISDLHISQPDVTKQIAHLNAEVEIIASADTTGTVTIEYGVSSKKTATGRTVALHKGINQIVIPIEILNPELWYPAGYGTQPLYTFEASVKQGNRALDSVSRSTGLRCIVLRRELDKWGRSFELVVNGIPVFAKGADVIPFDSFPSRVTTEQYRRVLQSAVDANMNMIRHWGGGYYETEEFYRLCDELGIMIWQDFMFGNDWQPGTYDFKQQVAKEAEYQVRRLRNHPSIVLWCGNNETEGAFHWGGRELLSSEARLRMWEDYLTVFSGILARTVERLEPELPYWPSSPSADYEETSPEYQSGDMHNWAVWHGMLPLRGYEQSNPRFMTEYGFQSFPEMRTIESFTVPEDRTGIETPVMLAHQKNAAGNAKIHEYMLRDYPEPRDFPSFVYVSQVLQAEAIKIGAEHLRRNRPRTMGSIYWQLNDCWPVASWSSLDYYGRWKALHYYARRFYNDLLVSPHVEDGSFAVYVVSDRTTTTEADLRVRLMTLDGKVLSEKTQSIQVPALSSQKYFQAPLEEYLKSKEIDLADVFVAADLTVGSRQVSSNNWYFVPPKQLQLAETTIRGELTGTGGTYRLRLSSASLARDVYVSFGDADAKLSDNYLDLLPGQSIDINIQSPAPIEKLRANLKIISLADAFPSRKP